MSEADRILHLRAARYADGLCILCGCTEPTAKGNPLMPDALTHCPRCWKIEEQARKRGKDREQKATAKLLTMISGGLDNVSDAL